MIKKSIKTFFLIFFSVVSLFPFYSMFVMSTHYNEDIFKGMILLPGNYLLQNLATVMESNFLQAYFNSLVVSVTSTAACVLVSALTGFALSKYRFKFRKVIYSFVLVTMMVPSQISLVGYVFEMKQMCLSNTHVPLILIWITNGFGVFWMTQYIKNSVPTEIVESSRTDGCGEARIFFQIVLPCIKPAVATLSMLVFLWSWNSYLLPLIIISREQLFTIPLFISTLGSFYRTDYAARMTGLTLSTIPILLIFIFGSKYFIKGLTAGAVKG